MDATAPRNPFDMTSPGFIADPYPFYRRLVAELPACYDERLGYWFIARYEDVHRALRDHRCSSEQLPAMMGRLSVDEQTAATPLRELLTNRLIFTDNPTHRRLRDLVQQAFTPRRVELMRPLVQAVADELLDRAQAAGRMDLVADFADSLPARVIAAMLGLPPEDRAQFKAWTDDIYGFIGIGPTPLADRARRATESAVRLRAYLAGLFARVRAEPRDDLLSGLVAAEESGDRLSETELFSNVVGMINAAHETTANLIANTVLTLLRNPEVWDRVVADPGLVPAVVEEGLRYESPIQMLPRVAAEDMAVGEVVIPRGSRVAILLGAANRDPAVFDDPDRFDPARPAGKHVAFGGGPHFCLGAALGRLEGQLAVAAVAGRFPRLRLAPAELRWRPWPVFRGLTALPLEW